MVPARRAVTGPGRGSAARQSFEAGVVREGAGDPAGARACYEAAIAEDPAHGGALYRLGLLARDAGDVERALDLLARAVGAEREPEGPEVRLALADLLRGAGRTEEAVAHYRAVLTRHPGHGAARYGLGKIVHRGGELATAVRCFRELTDTEPGNARAWNALGAALRDTGDIDVALAACRRALDIDPGLAEAHNDLGLVHIDLGQFESGERAFLRAVELEPGLTEAWRNLTRTRRFSSADGSIRARLAAQLGDPRLSPRGQADLHFALGKIADDLGEYDTAFGHYRAAKEIRRRATPFDRTELARRTARLREAFGAHRFRGWRGGARSDLPVLIVGMPRSGTTLVEQILASHPHVTARGELDALGTEALALPERLGVDAPYPECVGALTPEVAREAGERYLARLAAGKGALRATDKMPHNFLHLGLVALILPGARVVHVRRDPMDLCLSNYFCAFANEWAYAFANDLDDIAAEYHEYRGLMEHWRAVLPLAVLDLDYEALVADPQTGIRRLLDFCGLDWERRCLHFEGTARAVQTASNWQVRQPLYATSVQRWRRYAAHLEALRCALGDLAPAGPTGD